MRVWCLAVTILVLFCYACQQNSLTTTWVNTDENTVTFETADIVSFEDNSKKNRFHYRIIHNGGLEEGYTFWLELADPQSLRVTTLPFENINNYSYIKIDGILYKPLR